MDQADYLLHPTRASALPYRKTNTVDIPANMLVVREDEFSRDLLRDYRDEPYFKLMHRLDRIPVFQLPHGYVLGDADVATYARHINSCYESEGISAKALAACRESPVYDPNLWLCVLDGAKGHMVGSGIAEIDRDIGEGSLDWIQVSPHCRGRGVGAFMVSELLRRLQGKARFVTVSGRVSNAANPLRLYEKCGFCDKTIWHVMRLK